MDKDNISAKELKMIRSYRIIDDLFMNLFFDDDNEVTEFVLRIILDMPKLKVTSTKVQEVIENPNGRSVKLDIHAEDSDGVRYDIEMQRDSEDANPRRARYYSSLMDTKMLEPGQNIRELKDTYVIFITEEDVVKEGKAIYKYETVNVENYKHFNDGRHIIYVNASFKDDVSALGKLTHDLLCQSPDEMNYKALADKARYLKEDKEGIMKSKSVIEEIRVEAEKETTIEIALKLINRGMGSYEEIADITGLAIEKVMELARDKAV